MNQVALRQDNTILENVLVKGDLSKLTPQERADYYLAFCRSAGLNPLTKPMEYITLNGKLTLYALRNCTDQLRSIHKISVADMTETERDGVCIVTCKVSNAEGRTDIAKGAVNIGGLKGEALANAIMKAETKAKRRATLSICGLSLLDETEVEDIPANVKRENPHVNRAADIVDVPAPDDPDRVPIVTSAAELPKMQQRPVADKLGKQLAEFTSATELENWKNSLETSHALAMIRHEWREIFQGRLKEKLTDLRQKPTNGMSGLRWIEDALSVVTDAVELQDVWEEHCMPRVEEMATPDAEEAWGIFSKHEKRLEP